MDKAIIETQAALNKADSEVSKAIIAQFPELTKVMLQMLLGYNDSIDESIKQNAERTDSCIKSCDKTIESSMRELEEKDLTAEERESIRRDMASALEEKCRKDTEGKQFVITMTALKTIALGVTAGVLISALGGTFKIDTSTVNN